MRINVKFTNNTEKVPFDHHHQLVSYIHKCLGHNDFHDSESLYSISRLRGGSVIKGANPESNFLTFKNGAELWISAHDKDFIEKIGNGLFRNIDFIFGMKFDKLEVVPTPKFEDVQVFRTLSLVLLKMSTPEQKDKYYYYDDDISNELLTNTAKRKLKIAGISEEGFEISFQKDYHRSEKTSINYIKNAKHIKLWGSICPIIVKGSPEQIEFIWDVGAGLSTGIGLGSLYI